MIALCTAIRELLKREQRATFHDDLPGLVDSIDNAVQISRIDKDAVARLVLAKEVEYLRAVVARAHGKLEVDEDVPMSGVTTTASVSTYPRDMVVPRDRHDNDKRDIVDIKILPTEDEIRSDHPEFLPSTDLNQPHFLADQAQRHLDTHFRLLRHDIFGELKEALGGLMAAIEKEPNILTNRNIRLGDIRGYCYSQANPRYISFNHRRGLEVQISFPHPPSIRNLKPGQKARWWKDAKRLEEGVLLCLLSYDGNRCSLLFLTVSQKITDPNTEHGLTSHDHFATITAKLTSNNQRDLETLVRLGDQGGNAIMIELPNVLLATFVPVLESLQSMQKLSRLPFRQWILPDRSRSRNPQPLDIPPPLYSRERNFQCSLKSILKDPSKEFLLDPFSSPNDKALIDDIQRETNLDFGQCQGLVAALCREMCLIQGPPGTGKSHVGVGIMRVLLAAATAAKLGPIIVV